MTREGKIGDVRTPVGKDAQRTGAGLWTRLSCLERDLIPEQPMAVSFVLVAAPDSHQRSLYSSWFPTNQGS